MGLWSMAGMHPWVYGGLTLAYFLTVLAIVVVIVSENRNPVKTLAWVLVLLFVPVAGFVFYFYFGQDYTKYRMISRKSLKKLKQHSAFAVDDQVRESLPAGLHQQIVLGYAVSDAQFFTGNKVSVYTDGASKIEALFRDVEQARTYVHVQYYIFSDDTLGARFKELLIRKAQEGVEVKVLVDDVGNWRVKNRFYDEMRRAGIEVCTFLTVNFPRFANKINYRNHRKIVVVDGCVGFMGGMNIADRYVEGVSWGTWRDTHLRIEGPAVHALQSSFAVDWYFSTRKLLSGVCYFPDTPVCGEMNVQVVTGGPVGEWKELALVLFRAIANAREYLYIQTPYFVPTESLATALQMAALSKVDVRIMLPARSDSAVMQKASHSFITSMLKAGVKIYFYEAGFLHAKSLVIDDMLGTIGSTNMDSRSFEHNFEINAFVYNADFARQMKQIFLKDQKQSARITLRRWRRRPFLQKVNESVWRLLSPLL